MKGLLIKDFDLMKNQKRFFIVILLIAVFLMLGNSDGMFVVAYVTFLCTLFVLSTFSYDEFDNGGAYLMTLPITRKLYAAEKYVLGIFLAVISWGISSVLVYVVGSSKGVIDQPQEWWIAVISYLALAWIALSIMIPIQIKFGAERSRIVLMIIFGVIAVVVIGASKLFSSADIEFTKVIEMVNKLGTTGISLVLALAVFVVMAISFMISKRMMENKEY